MRVHRLTDAVAERLLEVRRRRDVAAEATARRIVADVRRRGDRALIAWGRRLDGADLAAVPRVSSAELARARRGASPEFLRSLRHAVRNIRRVARRQLPREFLATVEPGVRVGQVVRPLRAVGCYVPGGRHPLVSTLLMTVVPARVAGVRRVVVACPRPSAEILAAAATLGVTEVVRAGGAQAIAALAYGTQSIAPVDKIVGPGNRWVAAAKRLVSADVPVDMIAGPTEVLVVAARGEPRFIAADLVAQAEHDQWAVALLVTTSRALAARVRDEVRVQLAALPAANPARRALAARGAILVADDLAQAVEFASRFAPEHLSLPDGRSLLKRFDAVGSVFLGPFSAQSAGDFATGSNHTLPTGGAARFRGGLAATDFVRCISVQQVSRAGLRRLAPVVRSFAAAEGLEAHARAVAVRL